jgi:hypothetical protein
MTKITPKITYPSGDAHIKYLVPILIKTQIKRKYEN